MPPTRLLIRIDEIFIHFCLVFTNISLIADQRETCSPYQPTQLHVTSMGGTLGTPPAQYVFNALYEFMNGTYFSLTLFLF